MSEHPKIVDAGTIRLEGSSSVRIHADVVANHQKLWSEDRHAQAVKALEAIPRIVPPVDDEQSSVDWHLEIGNMFQNVWVR